MSTNGMIKNNVQLDGKDNSKNAENKGNNALVINLISGGVGGFCVVLAGYPFDLLKTRLQIDNNSKLMPEMRKIWRTAGWRGFYQGASAPLLGVSPIFAVNFYGYELGKRLYDYLFDKTNKHQLDYSFGGGLPPSQYAFAAAFSALQTSLVVIPAERIKVYMQMPRTTGSQLEHKNAIQVGSKLFSEGGVKALFRGTTTTLTRDVPGLMTFFTSYELLKQKLRPVNALETSPAYLASVTMAGGLAGLMSWMVSLPSDVLKSRVQAAKQGDAVSKAKFPTIFVLKELLKTEGPLALYKGITPVLLRAFPANAACFLGYETCKIILQRMTTSNITN